MALLASVRFLMLYSISFGELDFISSDNYQCNYNYTGASMYESILLSHVIGILYEDVRQIHVLFPGFPCAIFLTNRRY